MFSFFIYCLLTYKPFYHFMGTLNNLQRKAKMNERLPKERLGTSRLNDVFLKIYPYDPSSKVQELESGSDLTFMQSEIKICKADFSQTKKM